jgi:hypothetical protein
MEPDVLSRVSAASLSKAEQLALIKELQDTVDRKEAEEQTNTLNKAAKVVASRLKQFEAKVSASVEELQTLAKQPGPKGKDGRDGRDGKQGERGLPGLNGRDGRDGVNGKDGVDGTDGVGIASVEVLFDNTLLVRLTDGTEIDAGEITVNASGHGQTVVVQQYPSDVGGGGGGGSTVTAGEAEMDFGAYPGSNETSVVVTGQTGITAASTATASIGADSTSPDHTASDHRYAALFMGLSCGTPVTDSGFTIYARSTEKLQGKWTVKWAWTA